ncbi:MAG: hypothetical protein V1824_02735 [archaeon]
MGYFKLTGKIAQNISEGNNIGPSAEEQQCMMTCMGCSSPGVGCTGNSEQCMVQCNAQKPETTEETACMEKCILVGCGEFDFDCQNNNKEKCETECNMKGDAPDESNMSAEQLCITNCVASIDPTLRCGASQEGETGGEICQKCASDCVHLYAGPCLDDEKLKAKQKECKTCEHCYGEPIMGDSGEGWECITDVECKDASSEFGDEAGTGPGIGQEGYVASNAFAGAVDGIIKFFKGLFSGGEEESTSE